MNFAAQAVKSGAQDLVVAGGVENMTRVPMGADMGPLPMSLMEKYNLVPQGLSAEMIAEQWNFTRQQLDEFSLASQQKAWRAIQEGRFKKSIVPIEVTHNGERKRVRHRRARAPAVDAGGPDGAATRRSSPTA